MLYKIYIPHKGNVLPSFLCEWKRFVEKDTGISQKALFILPHQGIKDKLFGFLMFSNGGGGVRVYYG